MRTATNDKTPSHERTDCLLELYSKIHEAQRQPTWLHARAMPSSQGTTPYKPRRAEKPAEASCAKKECYLVHRDKYFASTTALNAEKRRITLATHPRANRGFSLTSTLCIRLGQSVPLLASASHPESTSRTIRASQSDAGTSRLLPEEAETG